MLESLESTAMSEAAVCVSEAGLEMPGSSSIPPSQDRRYGLPEQADSSFGYRNPAGLSPPPLEPTLTAELARAMYGASPMAQRSVELVPGQVSTIELEGGCLGEVKSGFFGGPDEYLEITATLLEIGALANEAYLRSSASAEMSSLFAFWAACMQQRGYPGFPDPLAVFAVDWPPDVTAAEVAMASADLECKRTLEFDGRARAIEAEVGAELLAQQPALLARWAEASAKVTGVLSADSAP